LSRLTSKARLNSGQWKDQDYDSLVSQAEANTGSDRLALYQQAEQIAISQASWIPLDHQTMAALIPSWVHGVTLNGQGLYFGDWSDIYLSSH
jgi:oligopeptide transport system substrate-binding protein